MTSALGWWRPVLRDLPTDPPRPPRWLLVVPVLVFVAVLLGIGLCSPARQGRLSSLTPVEAARARSRPVLSSAP